MAKGKGQKNKSLSHQDSEKAEKFSCHLQPATCSALPLATCNLLAVGLRLAGFEHNLDDIKLIFLIKRLLYEDKYTIEGARQRLRQLRRLGEQMNLSFDQLRRDDCISEMKKERQELLGMLNHNANEKNSNKS